MPDKRTILIASMGTSPAVLTETVWALCHQEKPTVPLCCLTLYLDFVNLFLHILRFLGRKR